MLDVCWRFTLFRNSNRSLTKIIGNAIKAVLTADKLILAKANLANVVAKHTSLTKCRDLFYLSGVYFVCRCSLL